MQGEEHVSILYLFCPDPWLQCAQKEAPDKLKLRDIIETPVCDL
jgi:hypothetical protein